MMSTYLLIAGGGVRGTHAAACLSDLIKTGNVVGKADIIAGVSVGSIIASLVATGQSLDAVLRELQSTDVVEHHSAMVNLFRTLQIYRGKRASLFSTRTLESILANYIEGMPVQAKECTIVVGDANKLEQVEFTFEQGAPIPVQSVMASCAILGAYPAVELQKDDGTARMYIDGGFSNAFPMRKVREFMVSPDAKSMYMFGTKPWLARILPLEMNDEFSVKNTTLLLFRQYWYSLTKLDHHQLFNLLNIPTEMVPDDVFAAVYIMDNEKWKVHNIVTSGSPPYTAPDVQTKIVYLCAPTSEEYSQYETMNLTQRHEDRYDTFQATVKFGRLAASKIRTIQRNILGQSARRIALRSEPLRLFF